MDEESKKRLMNLTAKQDTKGLILLLKDRNMDVRRSSAEALGKIGDEEAVEPLLQALRDEEEYPVLKEPLQVPSYPIDARIESAIALGKIGGARASAGLQSIVDTSGTKGYYRGLTLTDAIHKAINELNSVGVADQEASEKLSSKKWWQFQK